MRCQMCGLKYRRVNALPGGHRWCGACWSWMAGRGFVVRMKGAGKK